MQGSATYHDERGRPYPVVSSAEQPIRIGVVGTGFISRLTALTAPTLRGFEVARVLTRRPLDSCGDYPRADLLTNSLDELLDASDVIYECSGDPLHAFDVASAAVEAGLPVVTMNAEFHVSCGSHFVGRGLVTEAAGDQPGCQAALREEAVAMGFRPLVYGNMKGFLNHTPTLEEMEFWGAKQGISLPMVTASTDGTKVQFEQALVANAFGATIAQPGLLGLQADDARQGGELLAEHASRLGRPVSDYLLSSQLPHGVFLVATHDSIQRDALEYYKLGPGPYYTLVRPNIFVHLEAFETIRRAVREGRVLLDNSAAPTISVAAVAKRDLEPGTHIAHGIGSFDVRGSCVRIAESAGHVPIGLLAQAVVRRPIRAEDVVRLDDLEIPDGPALQAWLAIEREALQHDESSAPTNEQGVPR